jgi:mono/diheme cytochrome c family protein
MLEAGQPERGRLLYDTVCRHCHFTEIHFRVASKVRSMDDLQHYVRVWSGELGLPWTDEDIADVASYLNRTYYRLPAAEPPKP